MGRSDKHKNSQNSKRKFKTAFEENAFVRKSKITFFFGVSFECALIIIIYADAAN